MDRIARGVCLECGGNRDGGYDFCPECLKPFPVVTNIGKPVNGWQYQIVQNYPFGADDLQFQILRRDAFPPERRGRVEIVIYFAGTNRAEAEERCRAEVEKAERRAQAAYAEY